MLGFLKNVLLDYSMKEFVCDNHMKFPFSAEEASYEKGTAQSIQKEMNEADEANLLEEEGIFATAISTLWIH
jgi:hypothetical protein